MIDVFDICDELVSTINSFDSFEGKPIVPDGLRVNAVRAYHYVDGEAVPKGELSIVVYPLARVKQKQGTATKLITMSICVVIKSRSKPDDKAKNDALLKYGVALDTFLEGRPMCGAKNMIHEDELFYWFPDELHKNNHFSSALVLEYQHAELKGGNPTQ